MTDRADAVAAQVVRAGEAAKWTNGDLRNAIAAALREYGEECYDSANRDFDWLQSAIGKVYCSLTNSKLSKWNTDPDLLLAEVEDIQNEFWEKEIEQARSSALEEAAKIIEQCYPDSFDAMDCWKEIRSLMKKNHG